MGVFVGMADGIGELMGNEVSTKLTIAWAVLSKSGVNLGATVCVGTVVRMVSNIACTVSTKIGVDVGTIVRVGDAVAKALETRSIMASEVAVALGVGLGSWFWIGCCSGSSLSVPSDCVTHMFKNTAISTDAKQKRSLYLVSVPKYPT